MIEEYLTKTQIDNIKHKNTQFGSLENVYLADTNPKDKLKVVLMWFGGEYETKAEIIECPICHKKELVVYHLAGSPLTGSHFFKGYCNDCKEYIAFRDREFYLKIKNYVIKNRKTLKIKD